MSAKHRLRIREATLADFDAVVDVHFAAFDDNVMNQLMYPGGVSADAKKTFGTRIFKRPTPEDGGAGTGTARKGQPFVFVAEYLPEVGSTDGPGEIVAYAKWLLHREPQPEEEWRAEEFNASPEAWGAGCDVAVVNAFIGEMTRVQRDDAKGEACLYLGILACSPTRQRSGAGSALVEWGVNLADSLGLPSRVEASPVGYGLYRKFGYEDVAVVDVQVTGTWGVANTDGDYWGANNAIAFGPLVDGAHRTVIMRRPPKKATV